MIGLLVFLAAQSAAAAPERAYDIRTFDQAWQDFERFCVAPLPSPRRFAAAMDSAGIHWRRVPRTPEQIWGSGNEWRSSIGEITYHYTPDIVHVIGGPACHLEFRTDAAYRHDEAAALVERRLGLPRGTDSGGRRAMQMRCEMRRADGMDIRVFLSSNIAVPGGTGARLSISRRNLAPLPREMTGR